MRGRYISNYTKRWKHLFIYVEMVAEQLVHMTKTSKKTNRLVGIQLAKDLNC